MKIIHFYLGCVLIFTISNFSEAQSIENIVATFDNDSLIITYDLNSSSPSQLFNITLFSSHNNYQNPITMVSGDVGNSINPGKQKTVNWNVTKELPPEFNDEISIKIKAAIAITAKYKLNPLQNTSFKRGKQLNISWEGGNLSEQVNIDLLKNNIVQQSITQTENTHGYQWQIPKKQKSGNTYAIRISGSTNSSQNSTTDFFKIKPKIPLAFKIGVPILVGVLVGVLAGSNNNGGETISPDNNELSNLPIPVNPGGGG